jgi:hypothetical protein
MVVEDAPSNIEQVLDGGVPQGVPHRQARFLEHHDSLIPQYRKLPRYHGLVQLQDLLEFLNALIAANQDLEDPDADRVREGPEELCFEGLKLTRGHQVTCARGSAAREPKARRWVWMAAI